MFGKPYSSTSSYLHGKRILLQPCFQVPHDQVSAIIGEHPPPQQSTRTDTNGFYRTFARNGGSPRLLSPIRSSASTPGRRSPPFLSATNAPSAAGRSSVAFPSIACREQVEEVCMRLRPSWKNGYGVRNHSRKQLEWMPRPRI